MVLFLSEKKIDAFSTWNRQVRSTLFMVSSRLKAGGIIVELNQGQNTALSVDTPQPHLHICDLHRKWIAGEYAILMLKSA